MSTTYYNEDNVLNLPRVNVINDDDYLIVQNDNNNTQTSIIQFKNFVIGLKNTTFEATIENLENRVALLEQKMELVKDDYNGSLSSLQNAALNSTEENNLFNNQLGVQLNSYFVDFENME